MSKRPCPVSSACAVRSTTRSCSGTTCRYAELAGETFQLIYVDPPFNTGRTCKRATLETVADPAGERVGFGGRAYRSRLLAESSYRDSFDDYLGFRALDSRRRTAYHGVRDALPPRRLPGGALPEAPARRAVRPRVLPERDRLGVRLRRRDAALAGEARHDPRSTSRIRGSTTSTRARSTASRTWRRASSRPRRRRGQAPDRRLVARSCRPTAARRRATRPRSRGMRRMLLASTRPGDWCLDFFAGSGTLGAVAAKLGRRQRPDRLEPRRGRDHGTEAGAPCATARRQVARVNGFDAVRRQWHQLARRRRAARQGWVARLRAGTERLARRRAQDVEGLTAPGFTHEVFASWHPLGRLAGVRELKPTSTGSGSST